MSAAPVLPTAGFTILSNSILLNPNITIEAKATLGLLRYFDRGTGRGCFARKETLCHFLRLSPYRLRNALAELVKLGLITIHRRGQGNPDLIHVVRQEGPKELQPLQLEEGDEVEIDPIEAVEVGTETELGPVAEELPAVAPAAPAAPQEKTDVLEVHAVEIQSSKILPIEHYIEENGNKNIINNTLSTKPDSTGGTAKATTDTENQGEELIKYFYAAKEDRNPTQNELINWRPTAHRLLAEFTLDELKPAVDNAVAKGARLFYFVALTAPAFILGQRQQKQDDGERLKHAEKAVEGERQQTPRREALRGSAAGYEAETRALLAGLEARMRPQSFRTWFQDAFLVSVAADALTLAVASPGAAAWITQRYTALLQEVSGKVDITIIAGGERG